MNQEEKKEKKVIKKIIEPSQEEITKIVRTERNTQK